MTSPERKTILWTVATLALALLPQLGRMPLSVVQDTTQSVGRAKGVFMVDAVRFGAASVRALDEGQTGVMVALDPPTVNYVPLEQACSRMKTVPLDSDTVLTARDLGISFGD